MVRVFILHLLLFLLPFIFLLFILSLQELSKQS